VNLELISHYNSILMHLQDALHQQQMEMIALRRDRDELTNQLLRMQAERTASTSAVGTP
jgi:uncharacterized coiled-coil protein SlyX